MADDCRLVLQVVSICWKLPAASPCPRLHLLLLPLLLLFVILSFLSSAKFQEEVRKLLLQHQQQFAPAALLLLWFFCSAALQTFLPALVSLLLPRFFLSCVQS